MTKPSRFVAFICAASIFAAVQGAGAEPSGGGTSTPNMAHVGHLKYSGGSDLELETRSDGRSYAYVGTVQDFTASPSGLRIVEVTNPEAPVVRSFLACGTNQNDIQILKRGGRTYVLLGSDYGAYMSDCFDQVGLSSGRTGIVVIDVTDVDRPQAVSVLRLPDGAHNTTVHPGGRYVYVSNSDTFSENGGLVPWGTVEIVDLADPANPAFVSAVSLPGGVSAHDITFNAAGDRAYAASINHTVILDTSDPAAPEFITTITDPAINIHHQSDPYTLNGRTYLVISDELAGAAVTGFCPGGGLHVYDITRERFPVKVSVFFIPAIKFRFRCTSHVLKIYPDQNILSIGWYEAGTWIVDISNPLRFKAVGGADPSDGFGYADTWAAKMLGGYVFTNDLQRGMDVYRYDGPATTGEVDSFVAELNSVVPTVNFDGSASAPLFCMQRGELSKQESRF